MTYIYIIYIYTYIYSERERERERDQWNGIESPDTNPYTYCQPIFSKSAQTIQGEETVLEQIAGTAGYPHAQKLTQNESKT